MAWIRNNSDFNPKVTALPDITSSYVEGSLVVLQAPYGDVEYKLVNNAWVPNKALTDINMFISLSSGADSLANGGEANPFRSLTYATSVVPKQVKNLNINILDTDLLSGMGDLNDISKIDKTNKIKISGRPTTNVESVFVVNSSVGCFDGTMRKVQVESPFSSDMYTKKTAVITNYGTDPGTGWNFIEVQNYSFEFQGFYIGQIVYNENNASYSQVQKMEQDSVDENKGRMYLSDTIFTLVGQTVAGIFPAEKTKFVRSVTSDDPLRENMLWPVYAIGYNVVILADTMSYQLNIGDTIDTVDLPMFSLNIYDVNLDINISKLTTCKMGDEYYYFSSLVNCSGLIDISQSYVSSLFTINTPNIAFHKTILSGPWALTRSFTTEPTFIDRLAQLEPDFDNGDVNNDMYEDISSGIFITSSIIYVKFWSLFKAAVSIRTSVISGKKWVIDTVPSTALVSIKDSYFHMDSTSILVDFNLGYDFIEIGDNGVLDMKPDYQVRIYNVSNPIIVRSSSGFYREINYRSYETREKMLKDVFIPNGIFGNVFEEPGNLYLRQSDKWVVMAGNRYEDTNMPMESEFLFLPDGLEIFNLTIDREVTWRTAPQGE